MYTNTGYLDIADADLEDDTIPLRINCCGVYRLLTRLSLTTIRATGRPDYQLLYIASGKAEFVLNGAAVTIPAGNIVLYGPGEYQQYTYLLEDRPEVFWVHFTGYEAADLLSRTGLSLEDCRILRTGCASRYQDLFLSMIRELQLPRPLSGDFSSLYFKELLLTVERQIAEGGKNKPQIQKEMEHAVHFFHENFSADIDISDYAASLHMSTCWFIRSFKQYVGVPPLQYLTSIRINKAKELLESTDCPVSEIGSIIGYENPLYFSRIFKKQTGLSPAVYRKVLPSAHTST